MTASEVRAMAAAFEHDEILADFLTHPPQTWAGAMRDVRAARTLLLTVARSPIGRRMDRGLRRQLFVCLREMRLMSRALGDA